MSSIKSSGSPVEVELSETGTNLYIFFGGIAAGIAMPKFEFYNASKIIQEHKIFVRDFHQTWYQTGLPGISADIPSTAQFIAYQVASIRPSKVFFVGNSMGGFAAILYSRLTGLGDAITFAPQTFIGPMLRLRYMDRRWRKEILNTYRKGVFKLKVWDLKKFLSSSAPDSRVSVFVSKAHRLDHIHATHIAGLPKVRVHEFETGGHNVVRLLRDNGQLPAIMLGQYNEQGHRVPSDSLT